ncbi:hypothetical protein ACFW1A_05640 [Kitasatospora sp. NPDC058965]|uniref:hypothetical protein n=1 Tax=Kitasatospora sp. NPDC058965 TaxID=3346682 RepID=UPI0036A7B313
MKRLLGAVLAVGLIAGVVVLVQQNCCHGSGPQGGTVAVSGLIGSEKTSFFDDPQVAKAFADKQLTVRTDHAGSWQMAGLVGRGKYDFAIPAADVIGKEIPDQVTTVPVRPFYSPLVVVARQATVAALETAGLVKSSDDGRFEVFKTADYLAAVKQRKTWNDPNHPELRGQIYLSTTDPQSSASAALYLAAMAYLDNNNSVVADQGQAVKEGQALKVLMQPQGALLASSDQLMRDFLANAGHPLIWTYESEVAERAHDGTLPDDVRVLYPDITIQSDHTVVELTPAAHKLALALQDDPKLVKLEADHGFRPESDPDAFAREMGDKVVTTNHFAPNVADLKTAQAVSPSSDLLKDLITAATGGTG